MPKLKTHRGAAKRFKKTATGKFKSAKAYKSHILTKKAPGRKRGLARNVDPRTRSASGRCCPTRNPSRKRKAKTSHGARLTPEAEHLTPRSFKCHASKEDPRERTAGRRPSALAKGYYGTKSKSYRMAKLARSRSRSSTPTATARSRSASFRGLWIVRINAAARENEISYSRLMDGLKKAGNDINRKMLADLAMTDPGAFAQLVGVAKQALGSA